MTARKSKPSQTLRHEGLKCPRCEYDLRGLEGNVCPECGEEFDPIYLRGRVRKYPGIIDFGRFWFCRVGGGLLLLCCLEVLLAPFIVPSLSLVTGLMGYRAAGIGIPIALYLLHLCWPTEAEKKGYRF